MRHKSMVYVSALVTTAIVALSTAAIDLVLVLSLANKTPFRTVRHVIFAALVLQVMASVSCLYQAVTIRNLWPYPTSMMAWLALSVGAGSGVVALTSNGIGLVWMLILKEPKPDPVGTLTTVALIVWALEILFYAIASWLILSSIITGSQINTPDIRGSSRASTITRAKEMAVSLRPSYSLQSTVLASRSHSFESKRNHIPNPSSASNKVGTVQCVGEIENLVTSPAIYNTGADLPAAETPHTLSAHSHQVDRSSNPELRQTRQVSPAPGTVRATSSLATIPGSRPGSSESSDEPTNRLRWQREDVYSSRFTPTPDLLLNSQSRPHSGLSQSTARSHRPGRSGSACELIHPLFRPDSPAPPQILTSKTMVTASPLAEQTLTPRALARLRSNSDLRVKNLRDRDSVSGALTLNAKGQWTVAQEGAQDVAVLDIDRSKSNMTENQVQFKLASDDPSNVSILPSFVLSAGTRSSLLGYGKRKSVKRASAHLA